LHNVWVVYRHAMGSRKEVYIYIGNM
jgi:hypothetical protein